MALEVELKARVEDPPALREHLRRLGATLARPRELEDNFLLDDGSGGLRAAASALRVRRLDGGGVLTWKGPKSMSAGVKSREEIETRVDDAASLLDLLARLGYRTVFRYQKYRETWRLDDTHVMLDETPVGHFVEIEGDEPRVRDAALRLGVEDERVVAESYPSLFLRLLRERGDAGCEMVFGGAR